MSRCSHSLDQDQLIFNRHPSQNHSKITHGEHVAAMADHMPISIRIYSMQQMACKLPCKVEVSAEMLQLHLSY